MSIDRITASALNGLAESRTTRGKRPDACRLVAPSPLGREGPSPPGFGTGRLQFKLGRWLLESDTEAHEVRWATPSAGNPHRF
jgi:hypothetical protein